ncbi:hypothetical protein OG226_00765 [Streptomyces sp. NBC_01261]|uniref:hypothetical protein n=1 Tax=Streptomyces sp. NBC_01261 TaxID=2903802 RepID=UPI002E33B5AA|nr:hypothetical protein [Streptomyces sp. NBC_01261]
MTFESAANSQEEFPTLKMRINEVSQTRDATKVHIEDGQTGAKGQRAHVTSNIVFLNALQDLMLDKTWVEAWSELHSLWVFSKNLLQQWYGQALIAPTHPAGKKHKDYLEKWIADVIDEILPNFERGGIKLDQAWYVVPTTGKVQEKRAGRIYFDHLPKAAEYDTAKFDAPLRWKPNLHTDWVADLDQQLEAWLRFRGEFPWTSVDADSYVTSDRAGLTALDTTIDAVVGVDPTGKEAKAIAEAIIMTFDFFPDSFTTTRTIHHAAALAARHVVEHFRYRPKIQTAWRKKISDAFLVVWKEKVAEEIREQNTALPTKRQKTDSTTAKATAAGRPTNALDTLIVNWATAKTSYGTYYTAFATALN